MKKWSILLARMIVLEAISIAVYLTAAGRFGSPLDDAWPQQSCARNLGLHGVMAFSPGIPSAGGTPPSKIFRQFPHNIIAAFLCIFEWRLAWAAVSGSVNIFRDSTIGF